MEEAIFSLLKAEELIRSCNKLFRQIVERNNGSVPSSSASLKRTEDIEVLLNGCRGALLAVDSLHKQKFSQVRQSDLLAVSSIDADSFEDGSYYDLCEVCKLSCSLVSSSSVAIGCDYCPCAYHVKCLEGRPAHNGKWSCSRCIETGLANTYPMPTKMRTKLVGLSILTYSAQAHEWRRAVVIALHPQLPDCLLVKWSRQDRYSGKKNWLHISSAPILTYSVDISDNDSDSSDSIESDGEAITGEVNLSEVCELCMRYGYGLMIICDGCRCTYHRKCAGHIR